MRMRLLSLVFLVGSICAVNAIHQHDLNPALIEVKRAAARAHAGLQLSVSDPVRPIDATAAGLGILKMKTGTELRTVMAIDPKDKDQEAIRDMPTFFQTPSGYDPFGAFCGQGRFKTTWKTVRDIHLIVRPGIYAKLKQMDSAFLEEIGKPEKTKFTWRGPVGTGTGDLAKATGCELGHDVCADIAPQKEYDDYTFSKLLLQEANRILDKAKASCTSFFGLFKTPALAKDKYKYLCNINYDVGYLGNMPERFVHTTAAFASPLMFGTSYDGYINSFEVVLFGYPTTINSKFYQPKSWLSLVELVKSEPCTTNDYLFHKP